METKEAANLILTLIVCLCSLVRTDTDDDIAYQTGGDDSMKIGQAKAVRYLLYDVNPGEGFNLRRDVYMRVTTLVHELNKEEPWVLVLPPWGRLYHWKSPELEQIKIPWSTFFDLPSLRQHVPVIEFEEYLKVRGEPVIDEVYYLQSFKGGWTKWEEKMNITECNDRTGFVQDEEGNWHHWFFGYEEVYAKKFACVSYMGHATFIKPFLLKNTTGRCIMLPRAETLLHDHFGDTGYWRARRSMVFAKHLRDIGDEFRRENLDSTDEDDKTVLEDWTKMKRKHGDALGGPYVGVHLRRMDYLYAREGNLPSLKGAAKQVKKILKEYKLKKVFVATDAPSEEFEEFQSYFKKSKVYRFIPSKEIKEKYKDGGIAIIDQWIAAHARYFIGSYESTFSFRIQEEREILGFDPETTFNRFCPDNDSDCEGPSKWKIVY
ncbi:GDP-fucose protein O-fucosyltransferase 2-like [Saccostrea cucullata]|uniref:GDP-fucose protein O-fucosyltransferase 2-like n=1 Tax=Saccostrea cuccullata TaxID=36930 RepID=UPI002ED39A77